MAKSKAKVRAKMKAKKGHVNKAIKSKRAAAKRYKITGNGGVKVPHCGKRHNAGSKNRARKNRLKKMKMLRSESLRLVYRSLPNAF